MPCPDELALTLWLDEGLPAAATAELAEHLADCSTCQARLPALRSLDQALSASLALDADELAYLERLNLVGPWRSAAQPAGWWHWLIFLAALASFASWSVAGPLARSAVELVARTELGVVLVRGLFETLARLVETGLALAASPLPGYSLPLLAILGLVLLAGPRPSRLAPGRA